MLISVGKRALQQNQSISYLLQCCSSMKELKQIHAQTIVSGCILEEYFSSRILSFCAISEHGELDYAYGVFHQLARPPVFAWNAIIRGFSKSKAPIRAISLYTQMLVAGVSPDNFTFPFVLKACARLLSPRLGEPVHVHVTKNGLELNIFIQNSLMHMYSSCGDITSARKVFDEMPHRNLVAWNTMVDGYAKCGDVGCARLLFDRMTERDVVTWSAMIAGYVQSEDYTEALAIFEKMKVAVVKANEVTMVSVLCACAHLGALDQGRRVHAYIEDNQFKMTIQLSTALVDMYAKCGSIEEAIEAFQAVPPRQTDVLIWNAIIGGFAMHGLSKESLELFEEMLQAKVRPDEITYLALLSACAHAGLVEEAWRFFETLKRHGMTPKVEHYACMVDILGRAGHVDAAYEFINRLPIEPTAPILGALFNGCKIHGRLDIGELVGKRLIKLEPGHDGRYIGLSNIYADANRWNDARKMRAMMEDRGVKKSPGHSCIDVNGMLHRFIAQDKTHPQAGEIYVLLDDLSNQIKLEADVEEQVCSVGW
ncbi:pentatricopeptide repeat-containing protein At5g08305 [Nymphaea colorata]|nr:pentatricopeptide repeat-containing protein At5g08305 [Nymphaea colorata]